ncbi:TPA: hypothetical protein HA231_03455, partial [Candidatus Woesearchaeota archaeon]|nr:hypothetical protein [Candidatus Woesearchaeota archaeon]
TTQYSLITKRFVFRIAKRQNQRVFLRFLDGLLHRWPRLLLLLDNAPWHKGKRIEAFCKAHRKTLRLVYFPPYSPELNIIEQCWTVGKAAIANRYFTKLANAKYRLRQTFKQEKAMPRMFQYLCP